MHDSLLSDQKGRSTLRQSLSLRSRIVSITSIYLLIAALLNLYYGFTLFFSGAVALAFEGPGGVALGGQSTAASVAVDLSSGVITLFGVFLLAVGAIMVVTAIELYARKAGARTRTALVALLSIVACLLSIFASLTIQLLPLVLSTVVLFIFTLDQPLDVYLKRRGR